MNDSEFEDSLRALMPAAPPPAMEEKIASELSGRESEPAARESAPVQRRQPVSIRFEQAPEPLIVRCFHSLGWAIAGAASAVAAIALFSKPAPPQHAYPVATAPTAAVVTTPAAASERPLDSSDLYPDAETSSPAATAAPFSAANVRPAANTKDEVQGVETTRELISSEEGTQVIYRSDNAPMHQVRNVYREHHSWIDPGTGARVEIEVPREDVFLKPVSLQ